MSYKSSCEARFGDCTAEARRALASSDLEEAVARCDEAIEYFDQSGNPVGSGDSIQTLPTYGTWTVRQDNGHSFAPGGAGSALVYSDHGTLSAFVNEFAPSNGDGSSYSAVRPPLLSPGIYAPAIASSAYGGYTTGIGLLNAGTAATDIQIIYHDAAGHTDLVEDEESQRHEAHVRNG